MCGETTKASVPDTYGWNENVSMKTLPINLQIKDILMKSLTMSGFPHPSLSSPICGAYGNRESYSGTVNFS